MNKKTTIALTKFEIKMIAMALHHQWHNMTDIDGKAINCNQESADCVYDLLNKFRKKLEKEFDNE